MVGRLFCPGRSVMPTGLLRGIPGNGCASGCAPNTKCRGMGTGRFSDAHLHDVLGLVRLITRTRSFPWANSCPLLPEPDAGSSPVRFDERGVKTEHDGVSEAPTDERVGQQIGRSKPPRHTSTLQLCVTFNIICIASATLFGILGLLDGWCRRWQANEKRWPGGF